jgi:hypothetical protein
LSALEQEPNYCACGCGSEIPPTHTWVRSHYVSEAGQRARKLDRMREEPLVAKCAYCESTWSGPAPTVLEAARQHREICIKRPPKTGPSRAQIIAAMKADSDTAAMRQEKDAERQRRLRAERRAVILEAVADREERGIKWPALADELNRNGIPSMSGKPWTSPGIYDFVKRHKAKEMA